MDGRVDGTVPERSRFAGGRVDGLSVLVAGFVGAIGTAIRDVIARDEVLTIVSADSDAGLPTLIERHRPDVVLVNHEAVANVVELRNLVSRHRETRIVVAVMRLNRERDARLLDAGVHMVMPLTVEVIELCAVLRLVARGLIARAQPPRSSADIGLLTQREFEVMELLIRRHTAREIARDLHVTEATVNSHRRRIYEKLGVHSRAELADHGQRLIGADHAAAEELTIATRGRAAFQVRTHRHHRFHISRFTASMAATHVHRN